MVQHSQLDFAGQDIFIGLDVHKRSWEVSIMIGDMIFKTFRQPPEPRLLVKYLHRHFPGARYQCVYEAGYCGFWIHDQLEELGVSCYVINPADVPTTDKEKRHKTNTVDSRKLARTLSNNQLKPIYVPSRSAREDRSLLRTRRALVSKQTRCKNQIKALLMFYGFSVPDDLEERYWSRRYIAWLEQITFQRDSGTAVLQFHLKELMHYRQSLLEVMRAIRTLARQEPYAVHVTHLVSIPGISTLTAMILLTEIMDIRRFHDLDTFACFVGLVPGEHSSGDERTITGITPRRNPYLRWILTECAWVAVRQDPVLALAFTQLCRRMPKQRAIIRIARKLLNRIRFVLRHQQPCVARAAA